MSKSKIIAGYKRTWKCLRCKGLNYIVLQYSLYTYKPKCRHCTLRHALSYGRDITKPGNLGRINGKKISILK